MGLNYSNYLEIREVDSYTLSNSGSHVVTKMILKFSDLASEGKKRKEEGMTFISPGDIHREYLQRYIFHRVWAQKPLITAHLRF